MQSYSNSLNNICDWAAEATVHQQHLSNGSVVLVFEAFLSAPHAGETGILTVSTTDGSGPWLASQNISFSSAGESNATIQVGPSSSHLQPLSAHTTLPHCVPLDKGYHEYLAPTALQTSWQSALLS